MLTESFIRTVLNTIIDPCSQLAGAPAGISEFGLVRSIEVHQHSDGADIAVTIGVTEPGCYMAVYFAEQAHILLQAQVGVKSVDVTLDLSGNWSPADMSESYRDHLETLRTDRRRDLNMRTLPIIQHEEQKIKVANIYCINK